MGDDTVKILVLGAMASVSMVCSVASALLVWHSYEKETWLCALNFGKLCEGAAGETPSGGPSPDASGPSPDPATQCGSTRGVDMKKDGLEPCMASHDKVIRNMQNKAEHEVPPYNPTKCDGHYLWGMRPDGKEDGSTCWVAKGDTWVQATGCGLCHGWSGWASSLEK